MLFQRWFVLFLIFNLCIRRVYCYVFYVRFFFSALQRSTNQGEKTVIDHVTNFDSKQINDIIPDGAAVAKSYKDVDNLALELATDIESSTIIPLSKIHSIKFSRSGFTIFTLVGEVMNKLVLV